VPAPVVLIVAGVLAGVVGTGGGITSLVSYPALLAVGVPPLPASIANLVAAVVLGPGAAVSSRREIAAARDALWRLLPIAAVGGLAGAALLLATPPGVFVRVVPFLVAAGSGTLLVQPALTRRRRDGGRGGRGLTVATVGVVSIYSGYFGAGSGVMLFAVSLLLIDTRVPVANAVKNMLVAAGSIPAAGLFVISGPVAWTAVGPLAAGLLLGSMFGPVVVRHLPPGVVRLAAAGFGFVLAVVLWVTAG
jgi:uncharacterized membrane protein YfcA